MQIDFAPMEGITGYVFRRAHRALFSGVTDYYQPFIATHETRAMKKKERDDALPSHNEGLSSVPQLLSKSPEDFLFYCGELRSMGYGHVNLNLGCPSPTVTAKGKGAALLENPDTLQRLLDGIFSKDPGIEISVKTRLGIESPGEFQKLLPIYNRYPLKKLIVHGRTLSEGYKGHGHPEILGEILGKCSCPVCWNGNIFWRKDLERLSERYPGLASVMIGRGLVRNPALAREIGGGEPLSDAELSRFLDAVFLGLQSTLSGPAPVLGKMKEIWFYVEDLYAVFEPGTEPYRALRSLRKARKLNEYQMAKEAFFLSRPARKPGTRWQ